MTATTQMLVRPDATPLQVRQQLRALRHIATPWLRRHLPHSLRVERVRAMRYPEWVAERRIVATRVASAHERRQMCTELCLVSSPFRRATSGYSEEMQAGKEHNVRRAATLLNNIIIEPGQLFSYHHVVGRPSYLRGFVDGPEMHDGEMVAGVGGGCCQIANQLLNLALSAGLEVVERHRHALDLYPDSDRTIPFGLGATVFYNQADLRFRNNSAQALRLRFDAGGDCLTGAIAAPGKARRHVLVTERNHRFEERSDGWYRANEIWRAITDEDGRTTEECVLRNDARVLYDVPC